MVERQKDHVDRFAAELREAALLVLREAYWAVMTPFQLAKVQRNLASRAKAGRAEKRLQEKQEALAAFGGGFATGGPRAASAQVAPEPFPGATAEPPSPGAAAMGIVGAAATGNAAGAAESAGALMAATAMAATGHGGGGASLNGSANVLSDMERLAVVKSRIAAGRFVGEDEVIARDVAETVAYLLHRQGVLLRRLQGLAAYVEEAEAVLTRFPDDEDVPPDALDPTVSGKVATSFAGGNVAGSGRATVVAQQQLALARAAAAAPAPPAPAPAAAAGELKYDGGDSEGL